MTRRAVQGVALAAVAGVWAVAAWLLWQSKVPAGLHLPHVSVPAAFHASQLRQADAYDGVASLLWLAGVVVEIGVFALYARYGARFARESAAGPVGTGMLLGMLGFALLWLAEVPFNLVALWWERRHGLSREGYLHAVFGGWLALGVEFVLLCAALAIVMGLARGVGDVWWLPAAPVFVGLTLLFAFVSPYLVTTHRLTEPTLRAAVRTLERRTHLGNVPVVVEDVSSRTSVPNAEAMGIGPSRRVVLWDTLLDGRLSPAEVRVVIAHELGHVARGHVWKGVAWFALFAFPGAFLISLVARRRGGMGEPEAVPLAVFAFVVLGLVALPARNLISRHMESEADWIALQTTHDPAAAAALFRSFVPSTLSEPSPPTWDYVLMQDHPTIAQRLAMVRAWRRYATSASAVQLP